MNYSSQLFEQYNHSYPNIIVTHQLEFEDERKSYLPIVNKLELVIHRGQLYIKSTHDSHQLLRIIIYSLLLQAFTNHYQLIETVKTILFKQTLTIKGKQKDNKLLKLINQIPLNQGTNTEKALIQLFVDSVDTQIVNSFSQDINFKEQNQNQLQQYIKWFKQRFNLQIKVYKIDQKRHQKGIVLYNKDGTYLTSSCQSPEQLGLMNKQQGFATPISSAANSVSGKQIPGEVLDLEISLDKPNRSSDAQLLLHNYSNDENHNQFSIKPIPISNRASSSSQANQHKQNKPFSLWDYLCC